MIAKEKVSQSTTRTTYEFYTPRPVTLAPNETTSIFLNLRFSVNRNFVVDFAPISLPSFKMTPCARGARVTFYENYFITFQNVARVKKTLPANTAVLNVMVESKWNQIPMRLVDRVECSWEKTLSGLFSYSCITYERPHYDAFY